LAAASSAAVDALPVWSAAATAAHTCLVKLAGVTVCAAAG